MTILDDLLCMLENLFDKDHCNDDKYCYYCGILLDKESIVSSNNNRTVHSPKNFNTYLPKTVRYQKIRYICTKCAKKYRLKHIVEDVFDSTVIYTNSSC